MGRARSGAAGVLLVVALIMILIRAIRGNKSGA
jgi:hypothetical protein